jgi:hypothetical protein
MVVKPKLIFVLSAVLPPAVAILATFYAWQTDAPPFHPDWPIYGVVAGLIIGVGGIALLPIRGAFKRFAVLVVYVPLMSIILWGLVYITGCFNGYC